MEDLSPIVSTHWLNFMNNLNFCGLINFSLQAFVLPYHWPCTHPVLMSILQVNQSLVEVFTQRNFVADFDRSWILLRKTAKSRFVPPLVDFGVTYTVHLGLVGKCIVDFRLVQLNFLSPAVTVEALRADIGQNCGVRKGERSSTDDSCRQKTIVTLGYHVALFVWSYV